MPPIGRGGGRRRCQPVALRLGNGVPALAADAAHQRPLAVQREQRNAVLSAEVKDRQVEIRRKSPDPLPVDGDEKGGRGQPTIDPVVESGLQPPRDHFEADGQPRLQMVQDGDDMRLPAMDLRDVVRLAEEHHLLTGQSFHQAPLIESLPCGRVAPGAAGMGNGMGHGRAPWEPARLALGAQRRQPMALRRRIAAPRLRVTPRGSG